MSTSQSLLLFFFITLVITNVTCVDDSKWSFVDIIKGAWDIQKETFTDKIPEGLKVNGVYNFSEGVHSGLLLGKCVENEIETEMRIQADTGKTGIIKILESRVSSSSLEEEEEEEEFDEDEKNLMEFQYSFNLSNSIYASQTRFKAKDGSSGICQFLIISPTSFIINFFYHNNITKEEQPYKLQRITGLKQGRNEKPGFLRQFGPAIMISIFFIGIRLLSKRFVDSRLPDARRHAAQQAAIQKKTN